MSVPWTQGHCYVFPPFCLIPRVLRKIQQDQVHTVTLIANTAAVSTSIGNANKETRSNTKFNHTFSRSKRESYYYY